MMKWVNRIPILLIWPAVAAYLLAEYHYGFDYYFDAGEVHVTDPSSEGEIELAASSKARVDFTGAYKVIGRDLRDGHAACEGPDSGPIPYDAGRGYPSPPISMEWWEGPRGTCRNLPPGTYYLITCWTVERHWPFSPVSGCVQSNNFTVIAKESK